jgi:hypothetical protein
MIIEHKILEACVNALDLGPIKFKLANPDDGQGWDRDKIARVEEEYRQFLLLSALEPDNVIVPSREVDKFWHAHILDTRKYEHDCQTIFGRFLHHFPYLGIRGDEDAKALCEAYEATNKLHENYFGISPKHAGIGIDASVCGSACGGSCGAGCSGNNITKNKASLNTLWIDTESRPTFV